jgi:hypothetical protein
MQAIEKAVRQVMAENAGSDRFGLVPVFERAIEVAGGISVPMASGTSGGSAYDLLRVINQLEEDLETKHRMDITLFLDPRITPPNGVRK